MQWLRFAVVTLVATVLQAGLLANWNVKPDLLLIILIFFAVYGTTTEAIITSFVIGFAADIIGSAMGAQTISFGLLGTLLAYMNRVIAIKKMPYQSLAIFLTGISVGIAAHLLALLKDQPAISGIYAGIFWTSFYSAVVGPFLFLPCAWWMRIKTHRFSRP